MEQQYFPITVSLSIMTSICCVGVSLAGEPAAQTDPKIESQENSEKIKNQKSDLKSNIFY